MQMCAFQNSQTYGGVGNSVCYEWQEPDSVARVEGAKRLSIKGKARAEGEARDKKKGVLGRGLGEPLPRKNLKIQTLNSANWCNKNQNLVNFSGQHSV